MTLVEVLVVLAIVGVSAGAVVLAAGGGRNDVATQAEANRLADRLRLAADDALISGRPVMLNMTPTSYLFDAADPSVGDWAERHALPRGVRLSAQSARLIVDPDGAEPAVTVTVRDRDRAWAVAFDGLNATVRPVDPEEPA